MPEEEASAAALKIREVLGDYANYRPLSIAQFFLILICGISVLDFGVDFSTAFDDDEDEGGLGFNELIFGDDGGGKYWGVIQFWGYCMILVAIIQLLKALTAEDL